MHIELSALPDLVRERWPLAVGRAACKAEAARPSPDVVAHIKASQRASTILQRIVWLQRTAFSWIQPLEMVAACRKRCTHCCHIPVTILTAEAALIGRRIGLKPASPTRAIRLDAFDDVEDASKAIQGISAGMSSSQCPMLVDGAYGVYEVRPKACRLLLNLNDDDLLCQLVLGQEIPVLYLNIEPLKVLYLMSQSGSPMADIRDFFSQ